LLAIIAGIIVISVLPSGVHLVLERWKVKKSK